MDYFRSIVLFLLNVHVICALDSCCNCNNYEFEVALQEFKNHIFSTKEDEPNKERITVRAHWNHNGLEQGDFTNPAKLSSGYNGVVYSLGENYVLKVLKKNNSFIQAQNNLKNELVKKEHNELNNVNICPSDNLRIDEEENSINNLQQVSEISFANHLCRIDLDCVCKYYAVYESDSYYYIVLEKIQGETLAKHLLTQKPDNKAILQIFKNILMCISNLHNAYIVHLDLKSDNIMYLPNQNTTKLIDLGSGFFCGYNQQLQNSFTITLQRGAVRNLSKDYAEKLLINNGQLAKNNTKNDWEVCKKYDIWCCGCILYEMIFRKDPFPKFSFNNIWNYISSFSSKFRYIKNVYKDRLNFDLDDYTEITELNKNEDTKIFYTLLSSILTKDDAARKSIDELLQMIDNVLLTYT